MNKNYDCTRRLFWQFIFCSVGDGHRFGLDIRYAYQEQAGGIAEALRLTKGFVGLRNVAVVLGDNVFEQSMKSHANEFLEDDTLVFTYS